ncbi:MAG: Sir2 family NAD-dependent protein deacetylase, partial [Myxococcota bacterium]|nr:Sir2 family NAD-dependent protein deacetylase [Myxococcota bacterium]
MKNLVHQITQSKGILVLTGAGVSVASGIAPFRGTDPEAVWNKDVTEKGTYAYFRSDVLGSWSWYLDRFSTLFGKQPNLAHHALVDMEEWCAKHHLNFTLLTQNIDGLHRDAGSQALFEVHGTVRRLRCGTTGCRYGEPHG